MKTTSLLKLNAFFLMSLFLLLSSCSDDDNALDFTNPENLPGTTWKSFDDHPEWDGWEYAALKFQTTSVVEFWIKEIGQDEYKYGPMNYTINNRNIKFLWDGVPQSEWYMEGTINGQEMELSIYDEGMFFITWIFTKQ